MKPRIPTIPPFPPIPSPTGSTGSTGTPGPAPDLVKYVCNNRRILCEDPYMVQDVTQTGQNIVTILSDGKISVRKIGQGSKKVHWHINNKADPLVRIVAFNSDMYRDGLIGLTQSNMLVQLNSDISDEQWNWNVLSLPNVTDQITWINTTLSGDYLWITTMTSGYLYDSDLNLIETVDNTNPNNGVSPNASLGIGQRIYGRSVDEYLTLNTSNGTLQLPNGYIYSDVAYALLNRQDKVITVAIPDAMGILGLRLICNETYYLLGLVGIQDMDEIPMEMCLVPSDMSSAYGTVIGSGYGSGSASQGVTISKISKY